ncbi:hypothetical protein D1AOALGA4SA_2595 [Olavius algarvensis Delta 1 endosymbiont]|nr:hypothetical protein D1AOALGA4SA_2595 [Olavius algarvensis Delta 1 endosymbiont]
MKYPFSAFSASSAVNALSFFIEWTHKRKNSHYISMIR